MKSQIIGLTTLLLLTTATCTGCAPQSTASKQGAGAATSVRQVNGKSKALRHNFGVIVAPIKDELRHEFAIANDTPFPWTVKEIINMCSCSVADMASSTIAPGSMEKALVAYKPIGSGSFDDERKMLVTFEEESAPQIVLYVSAKVREPLTVQPPSIFLPQIGQKLSRTLRAEVRNYSTTQWEDCTVVGASKWLSTKMERMSLIETEPQLRQRWGIELNVDTADLGPGEHSCLLTFTATGHSSQLSGQLPVKIIVTTPARAIPAHLFFGQVAVGQPAKQTLKLRFAPDAVPRSTSEVKLHHSLGEQLKLKWLNATGETWELEATLALSGPTSRDKLSLLISFSETALQEIEIPIHVFTNDATPKGD